MMLTRKMLLLNGYYSWVINPYRFLKFSLLLGYFASLFFNKCFNTHSIWELSNSAPTPAHPTHPHLPSPTLSHPQPPKIFSNPCPTTQNNAPPTSTHPNQQK